MSLGMICTSQSSCSRYPGAFMKLPGVIETVLVQQAESKD